MIWKIKWDARAQKELRKLAKALQQEVLYYLSDRIATKEDLAVLVNRYPMTNMDYGVSNPQYKNNMPH